MSRLRFYLLLTVLYSCLVLGHGDEIKNLEIQTIPLQPQVMTSGELDSVTSSTPNTTTSKPTTTSPTTPAPAPTTENPTTTPAPAPAPAPTPTPTPTPAPGPLPPPTRGTWKMVDEKNVTCIVVQFAVQLNVTYTKMVDNNSTALENVFINVPATANVTNGSCSGDQWLTISWMTSPNATLNATVANNMTLTYRRNDTTKTYGLKSLSVILTPDNFINGTSTQPTKMWHGPEWQTPLDTSYRCNTPFQLNMTSGSGSAAITLSRLQEQAYRNSTETGFSTPRDCPEGDVSDTVPIVVGCVLGGLVVLVLVACLVGRHRSTARGYLSM